jgi:hypothetical protein
VVVVPEPDVDAGSHVEPEARYGHPIRDGLMRLIERDGTTTSTIAARELGESSGTCSFHLRSLASLGLIEEVPNVPGRTKPWRRTDLAGSDALNRELEDVAYASWLNERERLAPDQRHDVAFSDVVTLSARQLWELHARIRRTIDELSSQPADPDEPATPTAVVVRAFPFGQGDLGRGRDAS